MKFFKKSSDKKGECRIRGMSGDKYNELYNQTTVFKPIDMGFQCFQVNAICFEVGGKMYQCYSHKLKFVRYYPNNTYRIKELKRFTTEDNQFEYTNLYKEIQKELDEKFEYVYTITEKLDGEFFIYIVKGVTKNNIELDKILKEAIAKAYERDNNHYKDMYHKFQIEREGCSILRDLKKYELSFDSEFHFENKNKEPTPQNTWAMVSRDENGNYIFETHIKINNIWFTLKGEIK